MTLDLFLSQKPLFYDVIDFERFPNAFKRIRHLFKIPKIIHLVGTNGKGSTGRFLATALVRAGKKTGHYTSPHIIRFNERIWMNGSEISDEKLENTHQKLLKLLDSDIADSLSYFEYTTLLAMAACEECDYVVLEAGLGGEFDATQAFDKVLSIFTPIDFDHSAFLGNTIDSIASTKLRSMSDVALLGFQKHSEVDRIAQNIAREKKTKLYRLNEEKNRTIEEIALQVAIKNGLSDYLRDNLELSMVSYKLLGYEATFELFDQEALFGRLSRIAQNVTLDVGHNALAARAIAQAFEGQKITLIYNTYSDKEYREILSILSPILEKVEIIEVDEARIVEKDLLEAALQELAIEYSTFETINDKREYLVFGSFSVAETFLKRIKNT